MSRTYNTDPFYIQMYRQIKQKPPRNFREVNTYKARYWEQDKTVVWYDMENHYQNHFYRYGGMRKVCQKYSKPANRKYRANARQSIREGDYDILKPRRHAMWDAS
jgi:hypothetical protein